MTMMVGTGPFGAHPRGVFNFRREGPATAIYWEDFPKRFRIVIGGQTIADTRHAKALHESGQLMRIYIPREDIAVDRITRTDHRTACPWTGEASYWSVGNVENVAWSYAEPNDVAPPIGGYVSFDLGRVDAWYQEEDQGYAHPRDPYHRMDIHRGSQQVVVRLGDQVIARSSAPMILFETALPSRYYLAPDDVEVARLKRSGKVTPCPYKGDGQHFNVESAGQEMENAAWSLHSPLGEAEKIRDWISFYPDKLDIEVDGVKLKA